jgi:hypothetical protein
MPRDWEAWLQTAARPASATEEAERDRTVDRIRRAIAASTEIPSSKVSVYVKGSYISNTNVRRDSDVDVAVEWTGWSYVWRHPTIQEMTNEQLGIVPTTEGPLPSDFRAHVERAMIATFGVTAVDTSGDKAITVTRGTETLDADVVPCYSVSFYHGPGVVHPGHRLWPRSGGRIDNFPRQNLDNGRAKNTRTNRRYKQIVRCLKRLEGELIEQRKIPTEYPGYLVECLLYNIPDVVFTQHTALLPTLRTCLAFLWGGLREQATYESWEEVNALLMLFRGHPNRNPQEALAMVWAAWQEVGIV